MSQYQNYYQNEEESNVKIENQNFLDSFPLKIYQQLQQNFSESLMVNSHVSNNFLHQKVIKKVSCLIQFLLNKVKSKKLALEIAKNIQCLNDCKGQRSSKETIKSIAKLKLAKNSIQKEQVIKICHSLAMKVIVGSTNDN